MVGCWDNRLPPSQFETGGSADRRRIPSDNRSAMPDRIAVSSLARYHIIQKVGTEKYAKHLKVL